MFYNVPEEDVESFRRALETIQRVYRGQTFCGDMLITAGRNCTFCSDERFMQAFDATAKGAQEKSLIWRLHVLAWAARNALHLKGDFVECGVWMGFSSAVICKCIDFATLPRTYYLYDTFTALPQETTTPDEI